jgi:ribonuclease P protein component
VPGAAALMPAERNPAPADRGARGFRFPRELRLQKRAEFDRVYRSGRRVSQPDFFVIYLCDESLVDVRVGFTVGRALGGAVQRNRLRRRLREAVRLSLPSAALGGIDMVIQPRKSALEADFARLQRQIAAAFRAVQQNRGADRPAARSEKTRERK